MTSRGTKVWTIHSIWHPEAASIPSHLTHPQVQDQNGIHESTGAIASDSLAAESTRAGGGFSSNPNSEPQGVAGSNSTFANTDISSATRLDPASDAEARMAQSDWAEEQQLGSARTTYPDALGGQAKGLAVENTERGAASHAGTAPGYVTSQHVSGGHPKGANLKEGGFVSDDRKNASFTSDIGTRNDPGRAAEHAFERANAGSADATLPRQKGVTGDTHYETLDNETSA